MRSKLLDRRRAPRKRVSIPVEERTADALYFQTAEDLSSTGVFLSQTLPHPTNTQVQLTLHLPQGPCAVRGKVVEACPDRPGMAIQFVDLTSHQRANILWALRAGS